jgi:autotransporter-associated beta strand protein
LSLVKAGAGDLELIGSNSFGGGTLTDGDIRIHQPTSLGSGPVVSTGSAARVYWSGTASAVTLSNPFVTGDDITDALAFAPGTDRAVALAGTISGSGQIKISASAGGTLDLSGQTAATNTNTGGVEIGTGRVLIARGENLGGGTVNFGTGTSSILALAGPAASVSNPVTIGSTTGTGAGGAIIDSGSGTLTIAGTIADRPGNLPGSLVKLGSGTLRLSAANTYGGTTTVRQGTLVVANASAIASAPVSVASSATVAIAPYLDATAKELDLSGGGLVDLTTGRLAVAGGLSATQLVAEIVKGRGDGSWNGTSGITSSSAAADMAASIPRAVGWLDNGDGSVSAAFAAPGDTNIDWSIDILDAANFLALGKFDTGAAATWLEGDFSYDGIVDIQDAADFLSTGLFDAGVYNAAPATSDGIAAVPEPSAATFSVLGMLVLLEMRRRRRMLEQEDGPPSPR